MNRLTLVTPSREHEAEAIAYVREFAEHGSHVHGAGGLTDYLENYGGWLDKLRADLDYDNIPPDRVPAHTFFAVRREDGRIVGMTNIRHRLNDFLLREGGHIGYSVRPTERRRGYATEMLSLALEHCADLGIGRVLVTCDKSNIASARVIQKNGGLLENEVATSELAEVLQRYWIEVG